MKTVDPVQSVYLPSPLVNPTEDAWLNIEAAGGVQLSEYARRRIRNAMLTYAVSVIAVKQAPTLQDVRAPIKTLRDGANALRDGHGPEELVQALEELTGSSPPYPAAMVLWGETSSINLQKLLVELYVNLLPNANQRLNANQLLPIENIDRLIQAAETVLLHVDSETRGVTHGARNSLDPSIELLSVILPLYRRRGGTVRYFHNDLGEKREHETPLVCFVYEISQNLIPSDWPDREMFVLDKKKWSWRVKSFLLNRPK
jgi:hypothetical protein